MKKIITLLLAMGSTIFATAQIPNAGFENWDTSAGYNNPVGWENLNAITAPGSTYVCHQGTPGHTGAYYMSLISQSYNGAVVPGIAVSGRLDTTGGVYTPKSGFPYTGRPVKLTGAWQYMAGGTDQGFIAVLLTKWNAGLNQRDTIAYAQQSLIGMEMSWKTFSINLGYQSSAHPDSAMIVISASDLANPSNFSYVYVDDLAFSGSVPDAVSNVSSNISGISVYPNPAKGFANISITSNSAENVSIAINDLSGRKVKQLETSVNNGSNTYTLTTTNLGKGLYFVTVSSATGSHTEKLIVE